MANHDLSSSGIAQSGNTSDVEDSRTSRALTAIFSISLFTAVGALVGNKVGRIGSSKDSETPRILAWIGGLLSGLIALGSQPKPPPKVTTMVDDVSLTSQAIAPTAVHSIAPGLAVNDAQQQGKMTPEMVRERVV